MCLDSRPNILVRGGLWSRMAAENCLFVVTVQTLPIGDKMLNMKMDAVVDLSMHTLQSEFKLFNHGTVQLYMFAGGLVWGRDWTTSLVEI